MTLDEKINRDFVKRQEKRGLALLLNHKHKYSLTFDAETLTMNLINHEKNSSIALNMNSIFEQVANYCDSTES